MNELITRLTEKAGITTEQAAKAIDTFKDFIKEKLPMVSGSLENLFAGAAAKGTDIAGSAGIAASGGMMDKISDVIPGKTGEKVEEFVKDTAHKVDDAFDNLKDKVGGLFGNKKE